MRHFRILSVLIGCTATLSSCVQGAGEQSALLRGDQAYAAADYEEALAEYRLAVVEGGSAPRTLARVGHTYALLGRVEESVEHYRQAFRQDSRWADQAAADLLALARRLVAQDDHFGAASAVQAASEFRPGITVSELALPLARHYFQSGEFDLALPLYQRAMTAVPPDSAATIVFELAQAYEEVGDCRRALVFFDRFRETASRSQRSEADWHIGNCSYRLAQSLRRQGQDGEALRHLETTIRMGEPMTILPRAYFEKGDILALRGECDAALEAFRDVLRADPGSGALADRARERVDAIRFGPGPGERDPYPLC